MYAGVTTEKKNVLTRRKQKILSNSVEEKNITVFGFAIYFFVYVLKCTSIATSIRILRINFSSFPSFFFLLYYIFSNKNKSQAIPEMKKKEMKIIPNRLQCSNMYVIFVFHLFPFFCLFRFFFFIFFGFVSNFSSFFTFIPFFASFYCLILAVVLFSVYLP